MFNYLTEILYNTRLGLLGTCGDEAKCSTNKAWNCRGQGVGSYHVLFDCLNVKMAFVFFSINKFSNRNFNLTNSVFVFNTVNQFSLICRSSLKRHLKLFKKNLKYT